MLWYNTITGKGDNKLGKLLERVRADALAGKDTDVWCAMRFQLALPLDVMANLRVSKAGQIVAEPSFEGKPVIRMGEWPWTGGTRGWGWGWGGDPIVPPCVASLSDLTIDH